jgi:hypothetical protein
MNETKLVKHALLASLLASAYIACVVTLLTNAERLFGIKENVLAPIGVLLLFVVSAAVMGLVIFGKPVMLYLDGSKKEGVHLLLYTVGFLILIAFLLFIALVLVSTGSPTAL